MEQQPNGTIAYTRIVDQIINPLSEAVLIISLHDFLFSTLGASDGKSEVIFALHNKCLCYRWWHLHGWYLNLYDFSILQESLIYIHKQQKLIAWTCFLKLDLWVSGRWHIGRNTT